MVLAKVLEPWQLNFVPIVIEAGNNSIDRALYVAKKIRAEALVLGYSSEEFEGNDNVSAEIPVFYPLIGMSDKEIAQRITFLFDDRS